MIEIIKPYEVSGTGIYLIRRVDTKDNELVSVHYNASTCTCFSFLCVCVCVCCCRLIGLDGPFLGVVSLSPSLPPDTFQDTINNRRRLDISSCEGTRKEPKHCQ